MTDLAGTQLSNLLETLPGIATVLRSPVADAIVGLIRAGSGQAGFSFSDAEELLRYAVRRNLIPADESERVLAETRAVVPASALAKPAAKAPPPRPPVKPPVVAAKPAPAIPRKPAPPARPAPRAAKAAPAKPVKSGGKGAAPKKKAKPAPRAAAKPARAAQKKK